MENKSFGSRLVHAWNAFFNKDPTITYYDYGPSSSYRPDRPKFTRGNEKTIISAIYNRIAIDVASRTFQHVQLDDKERYKETIKSKLNDCLNVEANIDQTSKNFIMDVVMSMFDEGVVAIVPVDTTLNPKITDSYDICSMRTGKILNWYPQHVEVELLNEQTGKKESIKLPKKMVSIIENPFYSVMNEPNSTMRRLVKKLSLLDAIDEQSSSGKLDLIIQLPYAVKTDTRRQQADRRRKDIEMQLTDTKYGIAYTDSTEKVTQLNRPVENNLLKQVEYLTSMLFSQLSMNQAVLDGTADEQTMLNYETGTVDPVVDAIVDEMKRKFLTKTARSQNKTIMVFKEPFKYVPAGKFAEMSDSYIRNKILCSNEVRSYMGIKPSDDPSAEQLVNPNMPQEEPIQPMDQYNNLDDVNEQY